MWASQVGPERLISNIDLTFYTTFKEALQQYGVTDTPRVLFEKFIGGNGIPDQGALSNIQETFSTLVDLSQASSPNWRTRMFTLASTGHQFLEAGSDRISVRILDSTCVFMLRLIDPYLPIRFNSQKTTIHQPHHPTEVHSALVLSHFAPVFVQ